VCGGFQILKFTQLKWPPNQPEKAAYICEHCHATIQNHEKQWSEALRATNNGTLLSQNSKEFTSFTMNCPTDRLVQIWKGRRRLVPWPRRSKSVTKFQDRQVAAVRIWKAIQYPNGTACGPVPDGAHEAPAEGNAPNSKKGNKPVNTTAYGKAFNGRSLGYKRYGTTTLFVAIDIAAGEITAGHYNRRGNWAYCKVHRPRYGPVLSVAKNANSHELPHLLKSPHQQISTNSPPRSTVKIAPSESPDASRDPALP
jgi:Phage terminase large subunit (GpA)